MEADIDILRIRPNYVWLAVSLATLLVASTNSFHL